MPPGIDLSDFYYILPELVLTAGALIVLVADVLLPRGSRVLPVVTLLAIGATLASLAPFTSTHVEVAHGLIAVDGFALFFKVIFLGSAALTVLMSVRYLELEGASPGEYYFLILCATLGMMIMAGGIDLITMFIGLETMAISFYILTGFIKPNQRSNEAAVKYFLLGAFSLGILLYGMSLMYGLSGTTNLRTMATAFVGQERDPRLVLAVILVVAGMGFKIAAVPFHMWAPDVYEGAPTPVTAFLSVGSKAASFAMLLRLFLEGLPSMFHVPEAGGRRLGAEDDARAHLRPGPGRRGDDRARRLPGSPVRARGGLGADAGSGRRDRRDPVGIHVSKYPTDDPADRIVTRQRSRYTHYYFYVSTMT